VLHRAQGQGGRLSEAQAVASHLIAAGHGYLCTSSFDDAITTLKDWAARCSQEIHAQ
jgi:hypothetical protein